MPGPQTLLVDNGSLVPAATLALRGLATKLALRLGHAVEPMGVGSIQHCVRLARTDARLPATTHVHTLRHSDATHLHEEGVSIRLISA